VICPGETTSTGALVPATVTDETSPTDTESGTVLADWIVVERPLPNIDISDPGATGLDAGFTTGCADASPAIVRRREKALVRMVIQFVVSMIWRWSQGNNRQSVKEL
jgi:hypothetical protein